MAPRPDDPDDESTTAAATGPTDPSVTGPDGVASAPDDRPGVSAGRAAEPGPDAGSGPGDDDSDASTEPTDNEPTDTETTDTELTDDERWAQIVAELGDIDGYDGALPPDEPSDPRDLPADHRDLPASGWSGSRVVRPARGEPGRPTRADGSVRGPAPDDLPGARDWDGTAQYDAAEEAVDELEHFVPPEPGPVLGGDPLLTMAWFAVIGMPLFLLVVLVGWHDAPTALVQAAAAVFVLGIAVLVWRMPHRRDPGDDDTGAVV